MNPFYQSFQKIQNDSKSELPRNPKELANYLLQRQITPEQKVRELLRTKQMTPDQFEAFSKIADLFAHRNN